MQKLAIYGAGGFAHQLIDMLEDRRDNLTFDNPSAFHEDFFFVGDDGGDVCGYPVVSLDEAGDAAFVIAVADPGARKRIAGRIGGVKPLLAAKTALISQYAQIGEGAVICHHVTVEAKARIGKHFHANVYSFIAHECEIGDFVTLAPRVNCNGRVKIGDGAYIGTGAFLRQGITIGENAVIGMGAVVTEDVLAGDTVVGNPARVLHSRPDRPVGFDSV